MLLNFVFSLGKWPKNEEYVKTLKNIGQNYLVIILPICFIGPPIFSAVGFSMYGPLPTWRRLLVDLMFCVLIEDIFQYIFHRALHLPFIYPHIHKVHHEWTTPFAMAASYSHPAEVLILGFCTFAGPLMCRPHLSSFFFWIWVSRKNASKN